MMPLTVTAGKDSSHSGGGEATRIKLVVVIGGCPCAVGSACDVDNGIHLTSPLFIGETEISHCTIWRIADCNLVGAREGTCTAILAVCGNDTRIASPRVLPEIRTRVDGHYDSIWRTGIRVWGTSFLVVPIGHGLLIYRRGGGHSTEYGPVKSPCRSLKFPDII